VGVVNIVVAGNDLRLRNEGWEKELDERMEEIVAMQPMLHLDGKLICL
jgi:hypothetical protein